MTALKGTNVAASIVPFTDLDRYATHEAKYGKGGYRTVNTIEELNSIPNERREVGMLCYVINDPKGVHTYQLSSENTWVITSLGSSGIPIYDQEELDKLEVSKDDKYIFIPSENDLNGEVENKTYTTSGNGSYLDILFSTIRQLQSEVAKLKNSFKYGIYSYNNTETAMSGQISEITDPDEEPLWAIEPDALSYISGGSVSIDNKVSNLEPIESVTVSEGKLILSGQVNWFDSDDIIFSCKDSKLFYYITSNNLNISFKLSSLYLDTDTDPTVEFINLNELSNQLVKLEKYNILVIISREIKTTGGKNYVWISIGDPRTNTTLTEGYYSNGNLYKSMKTVNDSFTVDKIYLTDLELYKLDTYSKYQEFTQEVMPSKPDDQDYKYRVAHITIRSVINKEELDSIKNQLPNNELIFEEANKKLWIKNNNNLYAIGATGGGGDSGGSDDETMTQEELIQALKELGIVYEGNNAGGYELSLSSIADVTFIHQATGKQFKFEVDSEGSLTSSEIPSITLEKRIEDLSKTSYKINESEQFRGFVAKLHCGENKVNPVNTKDVKLNSDRVKIGAVYMPHENDTVFGCSHAFVELENTSDKDFPLNGCYLHYLHPDENDNNIVEHLALEGILPAGSTFLIRGKQYSDFKTCPNTYIDVNDYDMEWYINKSLIDFTIRPNLPYGFALTYGKADLSVTKDEDVLRRDNSDVAIKSDAPNVHPWFYIDSLPINKHVDTTNKSWGMKVAVSSPNSIIKNTFELDPAKQAFQALTKYDSSRTRLQNIDNDIQVLRLDKPVISFPHSKEEYPISKYTPKSSKQKKNVSTDKTQFDMDKPNAVNCSFGIDVHKTRCFNWVSAGEFDEYLWIKDGENWKKFESYKTIEVENTESINYPRRKEFSVAVNNTIYARLKGNFPGCQIHYTSHKCIIDVVSNPVTTPTSYKYVVGRADLNNPNIPDQNHCSEEYSFTLYPTDYKPRIFLTTDQQGFHWIEYQVWSAAANFLSEKIDTVISQEDNIFPVLLNTGDMTQNGTRVNEWLDYFKGAHNLINHLEHMAVVGNNDLCGPDPEILGTGDDSGKSNSYYFHVFFCYEVSEGEKICPIINNKYIPSLYYFDTTDYRFIMANSEITFTACKTWYGLDASTETNSRVYNIYTGHGVVSNAEDGWESFNDGFTSIYTMLWNMLNNLDGKKPIIACHEMPFTVMTKDSTHIDTKGTSRSVAGSLVGSHMNQLTPEDNKSMYWFSRLCEYFKVKLVVGGHKHTYAVTLPVREYYYYESSDGVMKNSLENGPMNMPETLKNDTSQWTSDGKHLSKFPILHKYEEEGYPNNDDKYFWPYTNDSTNSWTDYLVTYFMCQATGYKQTSNKELPTNDQSFSRIIPQTTSAGKADDQQKYPMYLEIKLEDSSWDINLSRICNIQTSNYLFNQTNFSTSKMTEEYAVAGEGKFCTWTSEKTALININV